VTSALRILVVEDEDDLLFASMASTLAAQDLFEYDRAKLPSLKCEDIAKRVDASVRGCALATCSHENTPISGGVASQR
jgi:hypothetical protein